MPGPERAIVPEADLGGSQLVEALAEEKGLAIKPSTVHKYLHLIWGHLPTHQEPALPAGPGVDHGGPKSLSGAPMGNA
ncbi:MAG: hypothetical protein F4Z18_11650 [Caldilineaceae bacterium SB0666_bin_21]|nr:hypothetical protein [Caldilineaceae bacterium SB0666_bin_21]